MATFTAYGDVNDFIETASTNLETNTLIGGKGTLSGSIAAGTSGSVGISSLTGYPGTQVSPTSFTAWILDGPNSETVTCQQAAAGNNLNFLTPTVYAHAAGIGVYSSGILGSLASVLRDAAGVMENICKHGPPGAGTRSLYRISRTEKLQGPGRRAALNKDGALTLEPYAFPTTAVSSCQFAYGALGSVTIDLSSLELPFESRRIEIPGADIASGVPLAALYLGGRLRRDKDFYVNLTFTAGLIPNGDPQQMPQEMRRAYFLLIQDALASRLNPTGAAEVQRGDLNLVTRLKGDTSGHSVLRLEALELLADYVQK